MTENEILIPVRCNFDIESLNHMNMPSYKAGDIFMFNPFHEIHVELEEGGFFTEIEDNECDFTCDYNMILNHHSYKVGDKITDEDIQAIGKNTIRDLCFVGQLIKRVKGQEVDNNKEEDKQQDKKPQPQKQQTNHMGFVSYAMIAKELKIDGKEFKKRCADELGVIIPDMRKKCPENQIELIKTKLTQ